MKTYFLAAALISISFGQLSAQKAKLTSSNVGLRYELYPEFDGYDKNQTFEINLTGQDGQNYPVYNGTAKTDNPRNVNLVMSSLIPSAPLHNATIMIKMTQIGREVKNAVVKFSDEQPTPKDRFVYSINSVERFNVELIDLKENKTIVAFEHQANTDFYWPASPSGNNGYSSETLLSNNYNRMSNEDAKFIPMLQATSFKAALTNDFHKKITGYLQTGFVQINYFVCGVKTKETNQFQLLDSAEVYLKLAVDELQINKKNDLKGNMHLENARAYVLKANAIYEQFLSEDKINWFKDANLKAEYVSKMKSNLYFTSFLLGNFEKAAELYKELQEGAKTHPEGKKVFNQYVQAINPEVFEREKRLAETFKTRYGY